MKKFLVFLLEEVSNIGRVCRKMMQDAVFTKKTYKWKDNKGRTAFLKDTPRHQKYLKGMAEAKHPKFFFRLLLNAVRLCLLCILKAFFS